MGSRTELRTCCAKAPTRIDLAGGTLDIPPLAAILFEKRGFWRSRVVTVNLAIDLYAEAEVSLAPSADFRFVFQNADAGVRFEGRRLDLDEAGSLPLHRCAARYFWEALDRTGLREVTVVSRAQAPRGSGLGGSSSLVMAILAGFETVLNSGYEKRALSLRAQTLEAGILGNLAGCQDHFAAAFGGVQTVTLGPDGVVSQRLSCDGEHLMHHMVLAYSGIEHFSAFNNWSIIQKALSGDAQVIDKLAAIAKISGEIVGEIEKGNIKQIASLMSAEWAVRRTLAEGISTPELDAMYDAAKLAGAAGGKICGAGGGGVLVMMLASPNDRNKVEKSVIQAGGTILKAGYDSVGLVVREG